MAKEDDTIEYIKKSVELGRYFLVILPENREKIGIIPLLLNGSEIQEEAIQRFKYALAVSSQEMALEEGYMTMGQSIDGRPRTKRDLAMVEFSNLAKKVGLNNVSQQDYEEIYLKVEESQNGKA